jgi:hypothetical protein
MQDIYLTQELSDDRVAGFVGRKPDRCYYDLLISESCSVYKPNGDLLLKLIKGAIPPPIAMNAFDVIHNTRIQTSKNRSTGAGNEFKIRRKLRDGTLSKTTQTINPETGGYLETHTGLVGYYDRYTRYPYARETAFLINYPDKWRKLQPFIRCVDRLFAAHYPERYRVQRAIADACASDWVIKDTAFSTLTINKNFQIAIHADSGDLREGFGVMAYLQGGKLNGGYLVIPRYRVAVKLESRDLILFDVHQLHGNTAIEGNPGKYERITCVFYLRENLLRCGNAKYEQERAKMARLKGTLYDTEEIDRANQVKSRILQELLSVPDLHPQQESIEVFSDTKSIATV